MSPTLTIAIPVYNRIFGFEESLDSAISVSECNEILIVDDNSNHNEFENISLSKNDSRVRFIKNSRNYGIFGNWNHCAELATSDFIAILCSDDIIEADSYKRFSEALTFYPHIDLFFGSFAIFGDNIANAKMIRSYPSGPITARVLLEDAAESGAAFPVLSFIRRKKLLDFPFVAKPHSGNDWLWIYTNAKHFDLYCDPKPLSYWRRHPNQDAALSQSITMDCWPMMYTEISNQLKLNHSKKAGKAKRRAIGVILSWLLNENENEKGSWEGRLKGNVGVENIFLAKANELSTQNFLLKKMLIPSFFRPLYYIIGRLLRRLKFYPF